MPTGAVQFFVEFDIGFIGALALERGKGSVADDAEKPGAAVFAAKAFVKAEGTQGGFLHDIPGVVLVAHEKAGETEGGIEVRHDVPFEVA